MKPWGEAARSDYEVQRYVAFQIVYCCWQKVRGYGGFRYRFCNCAKTFTRAIIHVLGQPGTVEHANLALRKASRAGGGAGSWNSVTCQFGSEETLESAGAAGSGTPSILRTFTGCLCCSPSAPGMAAPEKRFSEAIRESRWTARGWNINVYRCSRGDHTRAWVGLAIRSASLFLYHFASQSLNHA